MLAFRLTFAACILVFVGVLGFVLWGSSTPSKGDPVVSQVPIRDIVEAIQDGRKVVFVDTREPQEYAESHIPGAVNLPTRAMTAENVADYVNAAYVVPYCLKDFRGFEGARRLRSLGVRNVFLFQGFGVSAWRKLGLPVAGRDVGVNDEQAMQKVREAPLEPLGMP